MRSRSLLLAALALGACSPRFLQVEVEVQDLDGESIELELSVDGATYRAETNEDRARFLPIFERGTPYTVRVVQQPSGEGRRCAAPTRALEVGDTATVRCRVERVCERLAETRLTREAEFEEVFPDLVRPPKFGGDPEGEPRTYSDFTRYADYLYVASRNGQIFRFEERADVTEMEVVLDIEEGVQIEPGEGIIALTLHPRFESEPYLYVQYLTANMREARLSRFESTDGGASFDPDSETVLIDLPKPPNVRDHNGGMLLFGPDGMLWTSFGDGGFRVPPYPFAQETDNLYGTIVRIDVDAGEPYAVPADNPFVDDPEFAPEIWAYGLRNVFRGQFDRETGALFVGDVGGDLFEEIDRIEPGLNYGWPIREGFVCLDGSDECESEGYTDPLHVYPHTAIYHAVIGGPVYRGTTFDGLGGALLFADFQTQEVFAARDPYGDFDVEMIGNAGMGVVDFLEDDTGEVLLLGIDGGIRRMSPAGDAIEAPERISETGCMDGDDPTAPITGFVPYSVAAPLWSDDADKRRFFFVPDGAEATVDARGDLVLPPGSAAIKEFSRDGRRLETRLMVRREDGDWLAFSYRWNDEQTDAELVRDPIDTEIDGRRWLFPDSTQCPTCHTEAAGFTLGIEAHQLLAVGEYADLASRHLVPEAPSIAPLVDPADEGLDLETRARAFLHSNCSGCHRPGHPIRPSLDLRFGTALADTNLCLPPDVDTLGIPDARIVTPGDPDASVLIRRLEDLTPRVRMPPLASYEVAPEAAIVRDWVSSLTACEP